MPRRRVLKFSKQISINKKQRKFATVKLKLQGTSKIKTLDFIDTDAQAFDHFLALVHMLENDIVYYDSDSKLFESEKEFSQPIARP